MISTTINGAMTIPGTEGALLADRYRIVRQLGQGGMGSVWLAEDTQLDNKLFAIKMLPSILVSNKRAYRQLKDEALVAMKLVHPNIVTLRAFEENNGNPFLVMDYIEGQTLDDFLAEKGKLSEDETARLLKPIAAALDYAHDKGIVHRDVKPGNVMIGKDGTPFILDFGIAREIQETMTRVTGKLSSGTLLYMSPEQLNGEKPTPAQDIYSFAAMAYECLKGEPPFSHGQIEFQIMNKVPEPLADRISAGALKSIARSVMSGLAKKPEARPSNSAAVLEGRMPRAETQKRGEIWVDSAREEMDEGGTRSKGGLGKAIGVIVFLIVLAGGVWYASSPEAMRLKANLERPNAERRLVPMANISIYVNGELLSGEIVKIGDREYKTPIIWRFDDIGKTYGGMEVSFSRDGQLYRGKIRRFNVDWEGIETIPVTLSPSETNNDGFADLREEEGKVITSTRTNDYGWGDLLEQLEGKSISPPGSNGDGFDDLREEADGKSTSPPGTNDYGWDDLLEQLEGKSI